MSIVDDAVGGILIGVFVSIMAYGIFTLQVALYFSNMFFEPILVKILVGIVWVLETIHSALSLYTVYTITVLRYDQFDTVSLVIWSEPACILVGIVIMAMVHAFFIRRIWFVFDRNVPFTIVVSIFATAHLVFGCMVGSVYQFDSWTKFRGTRIALSAVAGGLSSAAITDILIAFSLMYYLRLEQGDLNVRFNNVLNRLIGFIVGTGMLTALTSIGTILAFSLGKTDGAFLGMSVLQSKVYANSLLTNLNLRRNMRARLQQRNQAEFTTVICQGISTQSSNGVEEMLVPQPPKAAALA